MKSVSTSPKPLVEVRGLTFEYSLPREQVLENLNFTLGASEICSLIGPSGCGKTTFLYLLAGLLTPSFGEVRVGGEALVGPRIKTAVILQEYGLFPWKTVEENVALGLSARDRKDRQKVTQTLEALHLEGLRQRYPKALSGGQRQRVAIARALIREPDLLLMDEPFAALDAFTREEVQDFFLQVWSEKRFACLLVTHQVEEAVLLGDKVAVMGGNPGYIWEMVAHPFDKEPGCRDSAVFFEHCRALRHLLRGGLKDGAI